MQSQVSKVSPTTGAPFLGWSCFIFILAFLLNEVDKGPQASLFWETDN